MYHPCTGFTREDCGEGHQATKVAEKSDGRRIVDNVTFRLDSGIMKTVRRDSAQEGFTLNSLVNRQLQQYTEWDRLEGKIGFTTVSHRMFREVLSNLPDEAIAAVGRQQGPREVREYIVLRWRTVTYANFLRFVENYARFATQYELEHHKEGGDTLVLVHALGEKWSVYLEAFMASALEALFGIKAESQRTDESVVITIPEADRTTL